MDDAVTEQPALTPAVRASMQDMLRRITLLLREMSRARRKGVFFVAEIIMETRLVVDHFDGRRPNVKRLIGDVVPGLIGLSAALKILREMKAEGLFSTETDPRDGRATLMIMTPTAKLIDRAERRWERLAAAA
jgi:hypothetical protein